MIFRKTIMTASLGVVLGLIAGMLGLIEPASASQPLPWQLGMQPPVTPVADRIFDFHNLLLAIITLIVIFVLGLLAYTCIRFKASNNPNPSRTSHNTLIEILWTAIPVLVLVIIAVPSFKHLYFMDKAVDPDMTIKVTANQWFWTYEYVDADGMTFDSTMVAKEDLKPGEPYLLTVDNPLVVPVGKKVQVLVTSNDVMHSFFVPSMVVQIYGIAGRVNETWLQADKEGVYYGQCNQICGIDHSKMPIMVEAVSEEKYQEWLVKAKEEHASIAQPSQLKVASLGADRVSN